MVYLPTEAQFWCFICRLSLNFGGLFADWVSILVVYLPTESQFLCFICRLRHNFGVLFADWGPILVFYLPTEAQFCFCICWLRLLILMEKICWVVSALNGTFDYSSNKHNWICPLFSCVYYIGIIVTHKGVYFRRFTSLPRHVISSSDRRNKKWLPSTETIALQRWNVSRSNRLFQLTLTTINLSFLLDFVKYLGPFSKSCSVDKIPHQKYSLSKFIWLPAKLSYKMYAFWQVVCVIMLSTSICLATFSDKHRYEIGVCFRDHDQKHVSALVIGRAFSRVRLCWNHVTVSTKLEPSSRWRIVKSNNSFVP